MLPSRWRSEPEVIEAEPEPELIEPEVIEPEPEPELPEPELPEEEPEPELVTEAPNYVESAEPLTTSLAAFQPATEDEPAEPDVDRDGADALAAAVAASAATGRKGARRRGGSRGTRRTPAGRRTDPKRTARGTAQARPKAATRKERKAERTQGKARKGGLAVRVLAIAIPVAAFAAAFILGAGSRAHDPPPARLATGSAQHGSATVASMATVPAPAKLVVVHHPAKKTKSKPAHKAATVTHSTATSTPSSSTPPASTPPAPTHSTVTTTQGSGGSSVTTNGSGTSSGSG